MYAVLLHGFRRRSAVNSSVSRVRLDSPWFAAPVVGQSSCRVEFAVSSDVTSSSSSFLPLELTLYSDRSETLVWSSTTDWNTSPRSVLLNVGYQACQADRPIAVQTGNKITASETPRCNTAFTRAYRMHAIHVRRCKHRCNMYRVNVRDTCTRYRYARVNTT